MAKSLDDIINQEFTQMVDLSKEEEAGEWLDSGNYALNYICSKNFKNAYPIGKISALAGLSGTGKSMLPANAAKDPKVDNVIVLDSEGGGTGKSLFEFIGAPLEKVRYMTVQTLDNYRVNKNTGKIEEVAEKDLPSGKSNDYEYHLGLITVLKKLLYALEYNHSTEKNLIIVDSLSNMKSVRSSLLGGEDMGKTNKLLNVLFSSLDNTIKNTNTTILLTLKVYTDLNNAYNTEGIVAGGNSVIYNPSLMLNLSTLQDNPELSDTDLTEEKKRRKTSLGNSLKTIRARVKKSRFGTEGRNAWLVLDATYGLTKYSGLFQLLSDFGVCIRSGSRYTIPGVFVDESGKDVSFYKKDFLEMFSKDEEKYIKLFQEKMDIAEEEIKKKRLNINLNINDLDDSEDDEISTFEMARIMEAEMENTSEEE